MTQNSLLRSLNTALLPRLRFPTELEFEPVQLCNAKCFCCPYTWLQEDREYRGKKMSREQIEALLTDFGETLRRYRYTGKTTINPFRYSDPLVCKDLDLILETCSRYGLKVQVTTNAVSFNDRAIELLERHIGTLRRRITISVIGSNRDEVRELMGIDLDRTFRRLQVLADRRSPLLEKIRIYMRVVSGGEEERRNLEAMRTRFAAMGIRHLEIKKSWMHNRIEGEAAQQSPTRFIKGCNLARNKILRRLEVMVSGDVVLCDDDAEGRKVFGNVFEEGIEAIWNGALLREHALIFDRRYSTRKQDLICAHCTRAEWDHRQHSAWTSVTDIERNAMARQWLRGNVRFM